MKHIYHTYGRLALFTFFSFTISANAQNEAGTPDLTFNQTGSLIYNPSTSHAVFNRTQILENGDLMSFGNGIIVQSPTPGDYYYARYFKKYDTTGTEITSFGTEGITMSTLEGYTVEVMDFKQLNDGRYLAFFYITPVNTGNGRQALCVFTQDGLLDTSVGVNGLIISDSSVNYYGARTISLQPDGKFLVCGEWRTVGSLNNQQYVARYNADFTLDSTFAVNGIYAVPYTGQTGTMADIKVLPDGKIICAGSTWDYPWAGFDVYRLNSNGTLDTTFADNGHNIFHFNDYVDLINALDIQDDGKIIVAGATTSLATGPNVNFACVARLNADGTLDETFGTGGKIQFNPGNGTLSGVNCALSRKNGKIVLAGGTMINNSQQLFIKFMEEDGSDDTAFINNGNLLVNYTTTSNTYANIVSDLKEQEDGKIVITGTSLLTRNNGFIARFNVEPEETSGTKDFKNNISVWPNPVNDVLNIASATPLETAAASLYTITGQELRNAVTISKNTGNNITISGFDSLPKGTYLLKISTADQNQFIKLIH